jgi:hypothetical protein
VAGTVHDASTSAAATPDVPCLAYVTGCGIKPQTSSLAAYTQPETLSADLSSLVLDVAQWGVRDPATLAFLDSPSAPTLKDAQSLLRELGALDADGRSLRRLLDEPVRQCLGQCGDKELFLLAEDRANSAQVYRSRDEAKADVFDYPMEFERQTGFA